MTAIQYRPNVGIVLSNLKHQVLLGKRIKEDAWQFPQGGIQEGESPMAAMYRELHEEIGLSAQKVAVLGRTKDWVYYDIPPRWLRRDTNPQYRGQKQIWFLLQLTGQDRDICIDSSEEVPEFEGWKWVDYWSPLEHVIPFKRDAYQLALKELQAYLP